MVELLLTNKERLCSVQSVSQSVRHLVENKGHPYLLAVPIVYSNKNAQQKPRVETATNF
jgi:hypothetical protein